MQQKQIISLRVHQLTYGAAVRETVRMAASRQPAYVCFANAHMIAEAHRNPVFAQQVNAAHLVLADGMPVARAFGWLYGIRQDRVAGMDFMPSVIAAAAEANVKLYLFGSQPKTLRMITQRIGREYPNLKISGAFSPPFGKWSAENNDAYIENIRNSGAQIVLVSLGCPKQETWMAQHYQRMNAVLVGIGGVFDVYGGLRQRAPGWMQRWALEWLYRLLQEPGRMLKRYAMTNSIFIVLILRQWLALKVVPFFKK